MDSATIDDLDIPPSEGTFYITKAIQNDANQLKTDGLCRPFIISATDKTSIYLAVEQGRHETAVHLKLAPFTLVQLPDQIFYSTYFWYVKCCDDGPEVSDVTKRVQLVYDIYFRVGRCQFGEGQQQEVPLDFGEVTDCHARAQQAFHSLRQPPHPARTSLSGYDTTDEGRSRSFGTSDPLTIPSHKKRRLPDDSQSHSKRIFGLDNTGKAPSNSDRIGHQQHIINADIRCPERLAKTPSDHQTIESSVKATGDVVKESKKLVKKAKTGLKEVDKREKGELIATLPLTLIDGQIEAQFSNTSQLRSRDVQQIWKWAETFGKQASALTWTLHLISISLRIVLKECGEPVPEVHEQPDKMLKWEKGGDKLRANIASEAAERLSEEGVLGDSPNPQVLFLPNWIWEMLGGRHEHAKICRILGLDIFADVQVHSPFVWLDRLQDALKSPRQSQGLPSSTKNIVTHPHPVTVQPVSKQQDTSAEHRCQQVLYHGPDATSLSDTRSPFPTHQPHNRSDTLCPTTGVNDSERDAIICPEDSRFDRVTSGGTATSSSLGPTPVRSPIEKAGPSDNQGFSLDLGNSECSRHTSADYNTMAATPSTRNLQPYTGHAGSGTDQELPQIVAQCGECQQLGLSPGACQDRDQNVMAWVEHGGCAGDIDEWMKLFPDVVGIDELGSDQWFRVQTDIGQDIHGPGILSPGA
ncbi:hypothetical protein FAGAP_936 [Fusarium agapanthi]|uniref:Uncharacterized protein n=1 Tax=Fusarium agapanthi TaxID=1803897 RepID=A0A9P5BIC8_9HYPO|nr:hypothetical protein FAGAP_936 [Fusarium agapanthi]